MTVFNLQTIMANTYQQYISILICFIQYKLFGTVYTFSQFIKRKLLQTNLYRIKLINIERINIELIP